MREVWSHLAVILLVQHYVSSQGNGCHSWLNDRCQLCDPGTFFVSTHGSCEPCPDKTYNDKPHNRSSCRRCRKCEGIFQYKSFCSATQNSICGCIAGKKCKDEECSQCENNPCPAGQQLQGAVCVNCPSGTFNPGTEGTCQPWKNCLAIGAVTLVNGTSTSDVVCSTHLAKSTRMPTTATSVTQGAVPGHRADIIVPVIICVVLFIAVFFVTIVCLLLKLEKIKNKFKPIQQTKYEEDCHFPEEEEGGEFKTSERDSDPSCETLPVV